MESYNRKVHTLRAGEKDINVVRSASPQHQSVQSVQHVQPDQGINKLVRVKDLQDITHVIETLTASISSLKDQLNECKTDSKKEIEEVSKQINNLKQETEQTKSERLKQKLDSFINTYNQNEVSHSDAFKDLDKALNNVVSRLEHVESLL